MAAERPWFWSVDTRKKKRAQSEGALPFWARERSSPIRKIRRGKEADRGHS